MKSARHSAELSDAFFAHPVGSRNVGLLVLGAILLKSGLLVLVACFGVQGWTRFEFLCLFHCFYCVFVVWTYIFALTSYAQARLSKKKSIAHKTVLCASGSGIFFSAENRLRISGCSENCDFHFFTMTTYAQRVAHKRFSFSRISGYSSCVLRW